MTARGPRILVSRTDRIGDVVLTLPLCALLAEQLGARVLFLGKSYTRPVLEASPYVHEVFTWEVPDRAPVPQRDLMAATRADAIVHVFPHKTIARAARVAGVPRRIGTSRRWFHWLTCTDFTHEGRRRSPLHEAQLNVRAAAPLLGDVTPSLEQLAPYTRLVPRAALPADVAAALDHSRTIVALHPKSRGSAREWPLDRWRALAESLDPSRFQLLVTGTREESALVRPLLDGALPHVVDFTGRFELPALLALLARVDGLVAASTGPLHLAAGLGVHALGLFSPTPPIHPGRWAPLGPRADVLVAAQSCAACRSGKGACTCLEQIGVDAVRERVEAWPATRATRAADA